jgi:hypothetical protein
MMDSKPAAIKANGASTSVNAPPTVSPSLQPRLGSLPFKKRRLFDATTDSSGGEPQGNTDFFELQDDDKFAALTLVAVAASVAQIPRSVSDLAPSDEEQRATPVNINQLQTDMNDLASSGKSHFKTNVVTPEVVHPTKDLVMSPQSGAAKSGGPRRIHHPPLLTPLPNGCHGQTSRNHSYCRRTPCFNGSKYCKLHYQQYVVAGMRAPDDPTQSFDADEQASTTSSSTAPTVTVQDRRYTGAEEERRCSAITTRGRACAYIAVNDTRFCFLHSDYANNPPPRRGGGRSTAMLMKQAGLLNSDSEQDTPKPLVSRTITKKTSRSLLSASVSSEESGIDRRGAKVSGAAESSAYPMLSSISSDLWRDRKVLITTGPLANRMGRVSKWGNGWVTCQILARDGANAEGLLHNRRSVELLLVHEEYTEKGEEEEEEDQGSSLEIPDSPTLARSVSGEVGPSSTTRKEDVACDSLIPADLTACVSADEKESVGECRSIPDSLELKSMVNLDEQGENEGEKLEYAQELEASANALSPSSLPGPPGDNAMADGYSEKRLAELLVGEGTGRKHSLDLLFGTAALDRGRRTISRPSRYEDTAMIEKGKAPKSPR